MMARRSARSRVLGATSVTIVSRFCAARPAIDAHRVGHDLLDVDLLEIQFDAAGLDLGHVENIVDDIEQELAAAFDVAAVFVVFRRAERAEHARFHDLGKSDDGIERRAQFVAHAGEERRFGPVGLLGACLLLGASVGEFGELVGLDFQRLLRLRRSSTVAISRCSLSASRAACCLIAVTSVPTET